MRFKKGDKVEIICKEESPASWHIGEILSCNGNTYHVKYDTYPGIANEQMVEIMSRKFMRPCPPFVQCMKYFTVGDIVEVFYDSSWKLASVLKVFGGKKENKGNKTHSHASVIHQNQCLVRLLGSSQVLHAGGSCIRTKQTWHNDKWTLVGKSSRGGDGFRASNPSVDIHNATYSKSPIISSRSLKRMSPYGSSTVETHTNGRTHKFRGIENDGKKQRMIAAPLLEKVHAVSYPRQFLGGKNMHASYNNKFNGYNQMEMAKVNERVRSTEISSSDSDACSVGSCSITSHSPKNYSLFLPFPEDTDTISSDAESCYSSVYERRGSSLPLKEGIEVSIHRLELHAYRSTLEALHASGPLSWDQEALLTNLRDMLHISNDEHLIELKHLASVKPAINVR